MQKSLYLFPLGVFLILGSHAQASALVKKDHVNHVLTVSAKIIYSGAAVTEESAQSCTQDISDTWNKHPTTIELGGEQFKVVFAISMDLNSKTPDQPSSCENNYIQILKLTAPGDRSYYSGLGSQNGVFYTSDISSVTHTPAHEFGHGLMLDHNPDDQFMSEVPGIMFGRGAVVKPEFRYVAAAPLGRPGSTVNPKYRQARCVDIQAIPFDQLEFKDDSACLGEGLNPLHANNPNSGAQ